MILHIPEVYIQTNELKINTKIIIKFFMSGINKNIYFRQKKGMMKIN